MGAKVVFQEKKIMKKNINVKEIEINRGQIYGLPKNPRLIRDERFEALKKSIQDAPEMLDLRELIVYPHEGKYVIIGGNMRFRACQDLGYAEIPCKVLPEETPVAKLREYVIKDNEAFGQNDWGLLSEDWDKDEIVDWGMEIPEDWGGEDKEKEDKEVKIEDKYLIEVNCSDEAEQEEMYNKLTEEGYKCRILTL